MTDAHDQTVTHRYVVHYPEHEPREHDPHYRDFHAYRERTKATAKCAVGAHRGDFTECDSTHPLELHHAHVEFSLQNGVDLRWLETDYPGISDPQRVGAWVESAANLVWLCVLPGVPVLMADGSERAIESVLPGEHVITHDGTPQRVLASSRKRYRGEVIRLGSALLTPTHRALTDRGWLTAADILREVGVRGPDVIRLRRKQQQVGPRVISPVTVDVVDALTRQEFAADPLLHNHSMLHNHSRASVTVGKCADVTLRRDVSTSAVVLRPRDGVQTCQSTGVGAKPDLSRTPMRCSVERRVADFTRNEMFWSAPVAARAPLFSGWVHDLSIAHNHSFIAGGIAVHNCRFHHRGPGGVHTASASDFEAEKYVRGLIGPVKEEK